jgi:Fibronectin type III domain
MARAVTPTGIIFDTVSTDTVNVSWTLDTPATEAPFMVISTASDFSSYISSTTGSLGTQTTAYHNLYSNTTYYFKVKVSTEPDVNYSAYITTVTNPNPIEGESFLSVTPGDISVAWFASNNSDSTYFQVELARDMAFTLNPISIQTTSLFYDFSSLMANTTYFARGKTLGVSGLESVYTDFGSTVTLAVEPSTFTFSAISSTQIITSWNANGNPVGTLYEILISTDNFLTTETSSSTMEIYYGTESLIPNTTYSFKVAAINGNSIKTAYTSIISTLSYATVPTESGGTFSAIAEDSIQVIWLANDNPSYTEYFLYVSTANDFSGIDAGPKSWFTNPNYAVNPLDPGTTYYFQVKARDILERETAYLYLGSEETSPGADNNPPNISNHQLGDDTWRGSVSGSYAVWFDDLGSSLSKFQVRASTNSNGVGPYIFDWSDNVVGIDAQTYYTNWQLRSDLFNQIAENTTSYVSVRVYDQELNVAVSTDVFYVIRDLTNPTITTTSAVSPSGWQSSDPGIFDVDFADALSFLSNVQYCASNQEGMANGNVIAWTDIAAIASPAFYTADWGVDFAALQDSATNYISVKAIDMAGNATVVADAFKILKNTEGPFINITGPVSVYVSTLTTVSGTSTKSIESADVVSNEIAFIDNASSKYWDGSAFNSAGVIWFSPTGLESWSYDVSTMSLVNLAVYKIVARSKDTNNNYSSPYSTFTFTVDTNSPTVLISSPIAGTTVYFMDEITGTAADSDAGLSSVNISIKRTIDSKWWDFNSSWNSVQVSSSITGIASWTFNANAALRGNLISGKEHLIYAQSQDNASPSNVSSISSTTFYIGDIIAPGKIFQFSGSSGTLPGRVDLAWVPSGDDGTENTLAMGSFAIGYSSFTALNFSTSNAQVLITTGSVVPGATQYYTVGNDIQLNYSTTYYFKIWVQDDADQWSVGSATITALSGEGLNNKISGSVKTGSSQGITGVLVEAIDINGLISQTAYTLDDGDGTFTIENLTEGIYKIQATWIENGIASSISKDSIPMGYADTDFILSANYLLASIDGTIPLGFLSLGISPLSAFHPTSILYADLYQNSRKVASAKIINGKFSINNLFPGNYVLHIPSSDGSYKQLDVQLKAGEALSVQPFGDLIKKDKVYAYPNPSRTGVTFHLESDKSPIEKTVRIFTIDGRLIKKFNDSRWSGASSPYEITWNYTNENLASGVYLYIVKVKTSLTGETKKVIKKFAVIR